MLQVSRSVASVDDVAALFSEAALSEALRTASGVLVQLFWSGPSPEARAGLCSEILRLAPKAVLVGASSSGQIAEGGLVPSGFVVSVSSFESAVPALFRLEAEPGREREAGRALGESLAACVGLKAALLLATPDAIDAAELLHGLRAADPSLLLFGGGAVRGPEGDSGVLCGGEVSARAVAAVALCGPELRVEARSLFGWRPIGPALALSEAERCVIGKIDGRPAFEHYRDNLGIEDRDDLYLLEFPLLIERDGVLLARNPLSAGADGSVRIGADAYSGETARLGYLDVRALAGGVAGLLRSLRAFDPQGIFLYSCVCRLFTLQEGIESETLPFQGLAPTAGFFTSGEFCREGGSIRLLNSSEVVVALREGPPSGPALRGAPPEARASDQGIERHARMTSHLFRFIGSLTERIDAANKELSIRNGELAASNASLCAEVVERRTAEEQVKRVAAEREILLRELQHRVKNSLAVISSIASIEAMQSPAPEARIALEKLESRIAALASLYDILYTTGEIEEIGLAEYLGRVVDYAAEGLGADARGISVRHRLEDLRIDVKRAISLGLVVNELVTDSVKYAYPGGGGGRVEVSLAREGEVLALRVEDDGVGLPPDSAAPSASSGFGLTLVTSLARQLDAEFSLRSEGGARFELRMAL